MASSTDQNGNTTSYVYNDSLSRLTKAAYPDGGSTGYSYNDSPGDPSITVTQAITSSEQKVQTSIQDGLGHILQTQLNSDPEGVDKVDITYDSMGLKWEVTIPYRTASDGVTTYEYDVLGRLQNQTQQDGSAITYIYSGNTTTATDEAGKARKTQTDALGRLTSVWEDPVLDRLPI